MDAVKKSIIRIKRDLPKARWTYCTDCHLTDTNITKLITCLRKYPDIVISLNLSRNKLTDKTGVEIAQILSLNTTIYIIGLAHNQFSEITFLAIAAALRVNTSLCHFNLFGNQKVDHDRVDRAYIDALRINPRRSRNSEWCLYKPNYCVEFRRLAKIAEKSSPPSMLEFLLCVHLNTKKIEIKKHLY